MENEKNRLSLIRFFLRRPDNSDCLLSDDKLEKVNEMIRGLKYETCTGVLYFLSCELRGVEKPKDATTEIMEIAKKIQDLLAYIFVESWVDLLNYSEFVSGRTENGTKHEYFMVKKPIIITSTGDVIKSGWKRVIDTNTNKIIEYEKIA